MVFHSATIMLVRLEQPEKAPFPIEVTELGISMLARPEQLEKAYSPIEASCEFSPNVMLSKLEHPEKTLFSI